MSDYKAPLDDMQFVLDHVAGLESISKLNGFQHADPETTRGILSEAGRFFAEVIAPTNRVGDTQGSVLVEGGVKTPEGFKAAYDQYVQAGWSGVHFPEEWGGGGLPYTVGIALQEMFKSANMAFSLCPLLTQAAIEALLQHGSDRQRADYLEHLVTAEWAGTMCLTEPQAGSDVGALTTKAVRADDGSYRIKGQKIFITWGDQDMTENIIHLVLARLPDAPPGTKGISLFIVPKLLLDSNGRPGEANDITVVSIEHKLGIHASPTCVLSFGDAGEGAVGYLVGEENQGMRYMFTMMNNARVGVGIEGLSIGERAYQHAAQYALERRQGRAIGAPKHETSLIVAHPDVRRMLMTMRAYVEAMRCLIYLAAATVDQQNHGESEEDRVAASERLAFLTPIAKAWPTDTGVEVASLGVQVHGGMGYVEETGAAQYYRDARIAPIYEGTNGIQAIDLVMRKLPLRDGAVAAELLQEIGQTVEALADQHPDIAEALAEATEVVSAACTDLGNRLQAAAYDDALAAATPFLRMWGLLLGGWLMARSALAADQQSASGDGVFLQAKVTTAHFYCTQLLPQVNGLAASVSAGAADLMALEPEAFIR